MIGHRTNWGMLAVALALGACDRNDESDGEPAAPRGSDEHSKAAQQAPASTSARAQAPRDPTAATDFDRAPQAPTLLSRTVDAWNRATNAGDDDALAALYAEKLSLYGRLVTRAEAVRRKIEYVRTHDGFEQTTADPRWERRADASWMVRFGKTTRTRAEPPTTVDAFLLFRKEGDDRWRIMDEGDVATLRRMGEQLKQHDERWGRRFFECPRCQEVDGFLPEALPPLGPPSVQAGGPRPPGVPEAVSYGRLRLGRFASAVDVPFFLEMSPLSGNGDGRSVSFDTSTDTEKERELFHCSLGGFWIHGQSVPKAPDPGHEGEPRVTFLERVTRKDAVIKYERTIFATDDIQNFVYCDIAPDFESFFLPIAQRMGRSLRAIGGGLYDRPNRKTVPYSGDLFRGAPRNQQ